MGLHETLRTYLYPVWPVAAHGAIELWISDRLTVVVFNRYFVVST